MQKYQDHPIAAIFPLMPKKDLAELAADIKQHGCLAPITLYEGKILDGRNRYRACKEADVEPKFREFATGDALTFVLSTNLHRRHLTVSQRAMIAAQLVKTQRGKPVNGSNLAHLADAAKAMEVSTHSAKDAKRIARESPEKAAQVKRGEKTIHQATKELKQEKKAKLTDAVDKTGFAIPDSVLEAWNRASEVAEFIASRVSQAKIAVEQGLKSEDVIFKELTNGTLAALKNIYGDVKRIEPHAVCTLCSGHPKKCKLCHDKGFISKFLWDTVVTEETKRTRTHK